jgi:hypothetical protein
MFLDPIDGNFLTTTKAKEEKGRSDCARRRRGWWASVAGVGVKCRGDIEDKKHEHTNVLHDNRFGVEW